VRFAVCVVTVSLFAIAAGPAPLPFVPQQESQEPKQDTALKAADTFFAGTIAEFSSEKVTVSRVVLGKMQKRDFRVTPDTKIEGRLRARVRVTVRYITDDDGDTATLIVVRGNQPSKSK
jgi:hypothetical protein